MTLREQMTFFGGIRVVDIAEELGLTREYVNMCLRGVRNNPRVLARAFQKLEARKKELRAKL